MVRRAVASSALARKTATSRATARAHTEKPRSNAFGCFGRVEACLPHVNHGGRPRLAPRRIVVPVVQCATRGTTVDGSSAWVAVCRHHLIALADWRLCDGARLVLPWAALMLWRAWMVAVFGARDGTPRGAWTRRTGPVRWATWLATHLLELRNHATRRSIASLTSRCAPIAEPKALSTDDRVHHQWPVAVLARLVAELLTSERRLGVASRADVPLARWRH